MLNLLTLSPFRLEGQSMPCGVAAGVSVVVAFATALWWGLPKWQVIYEWEGRATGNDPTQTRS